MIDGAKIHFWGPLGVCLGWAWMLHVQRPFVELNASFCASLGVQLWFWILFWRWTPDLDRRLALNASLRRQFLAKVWTIIYCWKALDVYFPTQLEARHFEFCSSRKSTLSAGRSESNNTVLLQPLNLIFAQVPQFQPENTWNHRKTHKLIVKSRNVNLT